MVRIMNGIAETVAKKFYGRVILFDSFRFLQGAKADGDGHHCKKFPSCQTSVDVLVHQLANMLSDKQRDRN
jgi:hypothetical protein